jgi:hypothetical protein
MTVIRIDPAELDGMASLLDASAGEYQSLSGVFASPDLGAMPSNVGGIVGQAYAEARSTVSALAGEFSSEARTLRFRGATASEQGGLGAHLGALGDLGYAGTRAASLGAFGAAPAGGLATAWSGLMVGAQSAGSRLGFVGTTFTSGATASGGGRLDLASNAVMLGGGASADTTTVTIGGPQPQGVQILLGDGTPVGSGGMVTVTVGGPQVQSVWFEPGQASSSSSEAVLVTLGGSQPQGSWVTPGSGVTAITGSTMVATVGPVDSDHELEAQARAILAANSDMSINEILARQIVSDGIWSGVSQAYEQMVHAANVGWYASTVDWQPNVFNPRGDSGSYIDNATGFRWNV